MGTAAGLGGPSLPGCAVAVCAAVVVALGQSAVQNVLDVLHYQVDGHCRRTGGRHKVTAYSTSQ